MLRSLIAAAWPGFSIVPRKGDTLFESAFVIILYSTFNRLIEIKIFISDGGPESFGKSVIYYALLRLS